MFRDITCILSMEIERVGSRSEFEMINGRCDMDILNQLFLRLPDSKDFAGSRSFKRPESRPEGCGKRDHKPDQLGQPNDGRVQLFIGAHHHHSLGWGLRS